MTINVVLNLIFSYIFNNNRTYSLRSESYLIVFISYLLCNALFIKLNSNFGWDRNSELTNIGLKEWDAGEI